MSVFISGSKRLFINKKAEEGQWLLPEPVRKRLDELVSDEEDILIGDCPGVDSYVQEYLNISGYKKVTVYVSGSKGRTHNNAGRWEEKDFRTQGRTAYSYRIEKDFRMAEDAEYGIAIWNGESKGTFINMAYLIAQGKKVNLYHIPENRWIDISSVENLRSFVGEEGIIGSKEVQIIMERCGFSKEMIAFHVSENTISPYTLADAVYRAAIPLDTKEYLLSIMLKKRNMKREVFFSVSNNISQGKHIKEIKHDIRAIADYRGEETIWTYLWNLYDEIEQAKMERYKGSIDLWEDKPMYLFAEWYDTEDLCLKSVPCGFFPEYDAVQKYIENEEKDNETDEGYYRLEVWDNHDHGWDNARYDYYYYHGQICWFKKLTPRKDDNGNKYYLTESQKFFSLSVDFNIRTPYKPGDVVRIDCRPFGPVFQAMILEARHQNDCCFPTLLFKAFGTDDWRITSLKHRRFFKDISMGTYEPMLSPLYKIRKVQEDEINDYTSRLFKLSKYISENEENAARIWNKWDKCGCNDMSEEEMLELFHVDTDSQIRS
ncbi:hypothetical protein [Butyrivibrio sp. NC2002]|uniref:hypothetical protein n=1 Tax=Butyrivibrio sp. NC2002 TaxID=1410610 RepID=UPI000568555C|nr:hypothetical protein [Butyrivibrio sp. NC2002]